MLVLQHGIPWRRWLRRFGQIIQVFGRMLFRLITSEPVIHFLETIITLFERICLVIEWFWDNRHEAQEAIMKVLRKGRPQKGWAVTATCTGTGNGGGGCGAKLLVEAEDLYQTSSSCLYDTDYFVTFTCPCCGVLNDLPWDRVPGEVSAGLKHMNPTEAKREWEAKYGKSSS